VPEAAKRRRVDTGLLRRAISKWFVGPLKYRSRDGYDAERYWSDRFGKYGSSLQGVGHEGMSEAENQQMYSEAAGVFERVLRSLIPDEPPPRTLEIGCGSGFYTGLLSEVGVTEYTGVDITSALFSTLQPRFPTYRFVQADITKDAMPGEYDLAIMIDVTEHIVSRQGLEAAFEHLKNALVPGGYLVVGPQSDRPARHLFYVHFWSVDDVEQQVTGWESVSRDDFRGGQLLVFRKPVARRPT
jgi:SAM-dependent methyltransferase